MVFRSRFRDFVGQGLSVRGNSRGVIFSNEFLNNYRPGQIGGTTGYGVVVYGNGTWPPLELGTQNAVFIEDNYFFGNRHNTASNNGSKYVFRYNRVVATDATKNFGMVDAHGLGSAPRGSRSWEIYRNHFSASITSGRVRSATVLKGGDGVAFENTADPVKVPRMAELFVEGGRACTGADQTTAAYFWNNTPQTVQNSTNGCAREGVHYFQNSMPNYRPFVYPHPLRGRRTAMPTNLIVR